jgi:hypothetical protein
MDNIFIALFNLLGSSIALVMILVFFAFALEIAKEITVSVWENMVKLINYIFKKGDKTNEQD